MKQVTFDDGPKLAKVLNFKKSPKIPKAMKNKGLVQHDECGTMTFFINLKGEAICHGCRKVVEGINVVFEGEVE